MVENKIKEIDENLALRIYEEMKNEGFPIYKLKNGWFMGGYDEFMKRYKNITGWLKIK